MGGAAWLLRGDAPEVADEPVTTIKVTPEVTVTTEMPPPTTVAPVTTMAPAPLPYDEVLDASAAASFTSMALASDGSPVIASYVSDANVTGSYEDATISVIRLVKCLDPECVETPVIVDIADAAGWGWRGTRLALDPFDRPVVGYSHQLATDRSVIVFCDDPVCSSFETRQEVEHWLWEAFTPDGNPVYPSLTPDGLDLVACLDRFCDATTSTRIDTGFPIGSWRAPWVAADGSVLLVYVTEEPIGPPDPETGYDGDDMYGTQKVAWCADAACSDGPVITTIDEGINLGDGVLLDGPAGIEIQYIARTEPRGGEDHPTAIYDVTYGKATCLNTACTEFELTHLGPYQLGPPPLPTGLGDTVAPDGSLMELSAEGLVRFSETGGGTWAYTTLPTAQCAGFFDSGYCQENYKAILAIGHNGLPVVVYGDDAGVHLIRCPDLACTRPEDG
jgi:hypothetical protein